MNESKSAIASVVVGLPIGLIGLIGSVVWYHTLHSHNTNGTAQLASIGPVILGFFSGILLLWALIAAIIAVVVIKS
jgi:hypothetical protein